MELSVCGDLVDSIIVRETIIASLLIFESKKSMEFIMKLFKLLLARIDSILSRKTTNEAHQKILDVLNLMDELFFYNKDICLAFQDEYSSSLSSLDGLLSLVNGFSV